MHARTDARWHVRTHTNTHICTCARRRVYVCLCVTNNEIYTALVLRTYGNTYNGRRNWFLLKRRRARAAAKREMSCNLRCVLPASAVQFICKAAMVCCVRWMHSRTTASYFTDVFTIMFSAVLYIICGWVCVCACVRASVCVAHSARNHIMSGALSALTNPAQWRLRRQQIGAENAAIAPVRQIHGTSS